MVLRLKSVYYKSLFNCHKLIVKNKNSISTASIWKTLLIECMPLRLLRELIQMDILVSQRITAPMSPKYECMI